MRSDVSIEPPPPVEPLPRSATALLSLDIMSEMELRLGWVEGRSAKDESADGRREGREREI